MTDEMSATLTAPSPFTSAALTDTESAPTPDMTLMIAESKTEEKDVMVKVGVNLINQQNE